MVIFKKMAAGLATTSISPNAISVCSVVFSLVAFGTLSLTSQVQSDGVQRLLWLLSAICIQGRLVANLLDGMVAIEGGKASDVGGLYNEVPDRISDMLLFAGTGLAVGGDLRLGLLAGSIAIFVAYVRAMGASLGIGQVFLGPMAKQQRMALLTLLCLLGTLLPSAWHSQMTLSGFGCAAWVLLIIIAGGVLTSIRRLLHIAFLLRAAAAREAQADV
jgi:phosphatidylglycerophosphate synthase